MNNNYTFSNFEIEDLLNNHAYEIAELLENTYNEINIELKEVTQDDKQ